jgi:hypothetical protein
MKIDGLTIWGEYSNKNVIYGQHHHREIKSIVEIAMNKLIGPLSTTS